MKKFAISLIILLSMLAPAATFWHGSFGSAPVFTPATCVAATVPANATKKVTAASITWLGWAFQVQDANTVQYRGVTQSSPLCGGIYTDNTDPNIIYSQAYAQEYSTTPSGDVARQFRAEIVTSVATDQVPTFGKWDTFWTKYQINIDSHTNLVGVNFQTTDQIHGFDTRMGKDEVSPQANCIANGLTSCNGQLPSGTAIHGLGLLQTAPGANLKFYEQIGYETGVPNLHVNNTVIFPLNLVSGTIYGDFGAFNTWHDVVKTVVDGHGALGMFQLSFDGTPVYDYKSGPTVCVTYNSTTGNCVSSITATGQLGFEYVDLLQFHGQTAQAGTDFTCSASGGQLTVSALAGGAIVFNSTRYANTIAQPPTAGAATASMLITGFVSGVSGSNGIYTITPTQTFSAQSCTQVAAQGTHSYQKIGEYQGAFQCNNSGSGISSTVTATISGTTMTLNSGTGVLSGYAVVEAGTLGGVILSNTVITGGSGTTWTVNNSQTVGPINVWIGEPWCHYPPVGTQIFANYRNYIINIIAVSALPITGTSGVAYTGNITTTRSSTASITAPTCAFASGSSIPGLSVSTGATTGTPGSTVTVTTCTLSGTPTTPGTYTPKFDITDPDGIKTTMQGATTIIIS